MNIGTADIGQILLQAGLGLAALSWGVRQLLLAMTKGYDGIIAAQAAQITAMQSEMAADRANCAAKIAALEERIKYLEGITVNSTTSTPTVVNG